MQAIIHEGAFVMFLELAKRLLSNPPKEADFELAFLNHVIVITDWQR